MSSLHSRGFPALAAVPSVGRPSFAGGPARARCEQARENVVGRESETRVGVGGLLSQSEKVQAFLPEGVKGSPIPKIGYHGWKTQLVHLSRAQRSTHHRKCTVPNSCKFEIEQIQWLLQDEQLQSCRPALLLR